MIKTTYICDKCKTEMSEPEIGNALIVSGDNLFGVEIKPYAVDDNRTNIHLCKYCIVDLIVRKLDDRPKPKPGY